MASRERPAFQQSAEICGGERFDHPEVIGDRAVAA
jgi:hypothetical protein